MSTRTAFVFSPRFPVNCVPSADQDIPDYALEKLKKMIAEWCVLTGLKKSDLDETCDLEDWTESAIYLIEAVKTGFPVYMVLKGFRDKKYENAWQLLHKDDKESNKPQKMGRFFLQDFDSFGEEDCLKNFFNGPDLTVREIIENKTEEAKMSSVWRFNEAPESWPRELPIIRIGTFPAHENDDHPNSYPRPGTPDTNSRIVKHPDYTKYMQREAVFCTHYDETQKERGSLKIKDLIPTCIDIGNRHKNGFLIKNISQHKRSNLIWARSPQESREQWENTIDHEGIFVRKTPENAPDEWIKNDIYNLLSVDGQDVYFTEKSDVYLVQEICQIEYEYRIILINGEPVCGAGAIESFSPLFNVGEKFDNKVARIRNKTKPENKPEIVEQLVEFARETWKKMAQTTPFSETEIVANFDVAMINGKPGLIESNPTQNLGLYSMNIKDFVSALPGLCQEI